MGCKLSFCVCVVFLFAANVPAYSRTNPKAFLLNSSAKEDTNPLFREVLKKRNNPLLVEKAKIAYLIHAIKKSAYIFIRNGTSYTGARAADHLFMKYRHASDSIETAKDFIEEIAAHSSMSGKPYVIKLPDDSVVPVRDVLYAELENLNQRLAQLSTTR